MSKKVQVDLVMEVLIAKYEVKLVEDSPRQVQWIGGVDLVYELEKLNIPTNWFFRYVRDTRG